MGGSSDAFALYLSLMKVDRPTDASKASTSLSFHKEAEMKFEYGTANPKKVDPVAPQTELMSYEEMKAKIDAENEANNRAALPTETVQANPTARNGRTVGGGGEAGQAPAEELTLGQRRQMAARAAEKRAAESREGLKAGEVTELQIRAQPAA